MRQPTYQQPVKLKNCSSRIHWKNRDLKILRRAHLQRDWKWSRDNRSCARVIEFSRESTTTCFSIFWRRRWLGFEAVQPEDKNSKYFVFYTAYIYIYCKSAVSIDVNFAKRSWFADFHCLY